MSPRTIVRAALLTALQLLLVVATLEVALRLLAPHHRGVRALLYRSTVATDDSAIATLPELMATSLLGFRPHQVDHGFVLNARSFRTREYAAAKPPGTFRAVVLGDSFTYGVVPYADSWPVLLEQGLAGQATGSPEVLSLGVPGTGVPFYLRLWQLEARRLDPDLVVLGFFVGNDFFDGLGNTPGWRGWHERLATVSYTYRTARNLLRWRRGAESTGSAGSAAWSVPAESAAGGGYELPGFAAAFDEHAPTLSAAAYPAIEAERLALCARRQRWKLDLRFARIAELLTQLHREVQESGARFVLVLIPDEFQVDGEVLRAAAAHAGQPLAAYDLELPQRRLRRFAAERGIEVVDLLPAFRREASERRLYLPRNTHWNRAGNRLAAECLLAHLAGGAC